MQRGARDRARRTRSTRRSCRRSSAGPRRRREARRDPVRLRAQARERRRATPTGAHAASPRARFDHVLDVCTSAARRRARSTTAHAHALRGALRRTGAAGHPRAGGGDARPAARRPAYGRDDERDLAFAGFLTFLDRPKEGVADGARRPRRARRRGQDHHRRQAAVAQHVAAAVGMRARPRAHRARSSTSCTTRRCGTRPSTRISSSRSIRIRRNASSCALKKMGHVVGFLGDGVNDAPAMHAADTSLSVEHAVDVAREAADFVLLERDLDVIRRGIEEGRRTFANTLKYILTTTSANLGNMVSMAVASLFLPFLPLLAGPDPAQQLPVRRSGGRHRRRQRRPGAGRAAAALGHALHRPLHGRVRPAELGLRLPHVRPAAVASSPPTPELFRTGWFVESLLTELVIALVVRTRRPFFRSRPGNAAAVELDRRRSALTFAIPYLPVRVAARVRAAAGGRGAGAGRRSRVLYVAQHGSAEGELLPPPRARVTRWRRRPSSPRAASRPALVVDDRLLDLLAACSSRTGRTAPPARRSACPRAAAASRPARPRDDAHVRRPA